MTPGRRSLAVRGFGVLCLGCRFAVRSIEVRRMDGQRFVVKVNAEIDERIAALTRRAVVAVRN